ncbi:MAG: hypothetical protein ABIQ31_00390 [Ferruginibacter sp.]
MNIHFLDSIISPDWLKYGFTGLAAIFGLLMYFIFKPLIANDSNKKLWIILFMVVSLIILSMGGFYVYSGDKLKATNTKTVDSLILRIASLEEKLQIYSGKTPEIETLVKKINDNKHSFDSLDKLNQNLDLSVKSQQTLITGLVSRSIIESIENDMTATEGKGGLPQNYPDVEFKRLQRAVFLNFYSFNGNKEILKQTLNALQKQTGDIKSSTINRLLSIFPALMRQKYNWLKNQAIPELEKSIAYLRDNPMVQETVHANVKLPKEIWIIPIEDKFCNVAFVADLVGLKKEKELLANKLIEQ